MPRTIIYDAVSRAILLLDPPQDADGRSVLPAVATAAIARISDAEAAKLSTATSVFTLASDGQTVLVAAPPPGDPVIVAAQQEDQTANIDVRANYQAMLTRLDQVINFAGTPTQAQVWSAVQDEARMLRRLARLLYVRLSTPQ